MAGLALAPGKAVGSAAVSLPDDDLLGVAYLHDCPPDERRATGSTYTPPSLVAQMVERAREQVSPAVVVDCGCGSGRFSLACARAFPQARVVAVDSSERACSLCEANVRSAGLAERVEVVHHDFLSYMPPRGDGPTLWIGNPPYVRHHDIDARQKGWFAEATQALGRRGSLLSGLHAYFVARIAQLWQPGDWGVLVTSAEWLDVNYGAFLRWLLVRRLGLRSLEAFDPRERVFADAMTTSCVISFGDGPLGEDAMVSVRRHGEPWRQLRASCLAQSDRWTRLVSDGDVPARSGDGLVRLGSMAAVHRGVVTGDNAFWVRGGDEATGIPEGLLVPIVSHAREIRDAQRDPSSLGRLVVLPADLGMLDGATAAAAERIVGEGRARGVDRGYVASHRRPWWAVRLPEPPAIMMTYMGRSGPTFVLNDRHLPMLNVIHGIYPRRPMSRGALVRLTDYLNTSVSLADGRTYSGGLVKFEPREAEALLVPPLDVLEG